MPGVAIKTTIFSQCLSLWVVTAFVVHFATGWTSFEAEGFTFWRSDCGRAGPRDGSRNDGLG